jgi:hypothetical protein
VVLRRPSRQCLHIAVLISACRGPFQQRTSHSSNRRFHVVIRNHTVGVLHSSVRRTRLSSQISRPLSVVGFVGRDSRSRTVVCMSNLTACVPGARVGTVIGEAMLVLLPELFNSLELLKGSGWVARRTEITEMPGRVGDVGGHCGGRSTVGNLSDFTAGIPCAVIATAQPSQLSM